ncbi:hypothetical protein D3C79_926680 [compost metagenome]
MPGGPAGLSASEAALTQKHRRDMDKSLAQQAAALTGYLQPATSFTQGWRGPVELDQNMKQRRCWQQFLAATGNRQWPAES